jgi:hypothetical protein
MKINLPTDYDSLEQRTIDELKEIADDDERAYIEVLFLFGSLSAFIAGQIDMLDNLDPGKLGRVIRVLADSIDIAIMEVIKRHEGKVH